MTDFYLNLKESIIIMEKIEKFERSIKEAKDLEQNLTDQLVNAKQELQNSNNQNRNNNIINDSLEYCIFTIFR